MKPQNAITMKIKTRFLFYSIIIIGVCLLFTNSCKKEDNSKIATLSTTDVSGITQSTATSGGNITDDGKASITARGVCWNTTENPTTANSKTSDGNGNGEFTSSITGLTANTKYYIRSYATNSAGTAYGSQKNFTTALAIVIPTVTTAAITNLTSTSATAGGIVTSAGNGTVTESGVYWGTSENPENTGTKVPMGSGVGSFSANLGGVQPNTTYFVKAYAKNSAGTAYGSQVTFTTPQIITAPTVTTNDVNTFTSTTATVGGNVTSSGNGTVTERGVFYGTSTNPELAGTKFQIGSGSGSFSNSLTGLTPNTLYYVKAYAINSAGTSYGTQVRFTTPVQITAPIVFTTSVTVFDITTATFAGEVTSSGNATVTERGVFWGISQSPETTGTKLQIGSGIGMFTINVTSLTQNTTYYVKAYAVNSAGTSYGAEVSFTTKPAQLPSVTTTYISAISNTSATGGGNVSYDGGAAVTARGVCWSTSSNPTVSLTTKTLDGTGLGTFISSIDGLTENTLYHVRAYATNIAGTAYGNEVSFTPELKIGSPYEGGIVAYILQSGDPGYVVGERHGLIAAPTDQATDSWWTNTDYPLIGASGTALGTGNANTNIIVTYMGTSACAARFCSDLVIGIYSDWYLPSKDELNKLYLSKVLIGGFANAYYWSSSEYDANYAWYQSFNTGGQFNFSKSQLNRVRAVRSF